MSAVDDLFAELKRRRRCALMPFLTAGDPSISATASLVAACRRGGADLCEIGIPYSDPIADGPVIQASYQRALDDGFKLDDAMRLGKQIHKDLTADDSGGSNASAAPFPRVTMVSYAIIYRVGVDEYLRRSIDAGYAGAIVPDLPVEEAAELSRRCGERDFSLVQLVTPTTPRDRQLRIAENSSGFLYYVSVTGITGERSQLPPDLADNVAWIRDQTPLPICIGFGISGPDTAATLAPVADGLIVGSAIVRRIAAAANADEAIDSVHRFTGELRDAIDSATTHDDA